MAEVLPFPAGGYHFIKGPFQYSAGVAAETGFEIERARFRRPVPIEEGFRAIEAYLNARGRAPTAFCACELRSPEPFTEEGFKAFNRIYVGTLERWGLFKNEVNPVARSNVCPELDKPAAPGFHAFSYTVPAAAGRATELHHRRQRRSRRRTGQLSRAHHPLRRHLARGHAREGALGARRAGAADGGARRGWADRHRDAGLHGPRHSFVPRRGDRRARGDARRSDVALTRGRRCRGSTTRWTCAASRGKS